jgi:aspartate aminotransferase-like enzyme
MENYPMDNKQMLMIPGPTRYQNKCYWPWLGTPISHRSDEFSAIMAEVTQNLKWLHQTKNDVLVLTASGTGRWKQGLLTF